MPKFVPLTSSGRPRVLVVVGLLLVAGLLSAATSTPSARYRVPRHAFIDYCAATSQLSEVQVVNDTNRPVQATFLGEAGQVREIPPGSSVMLTLAPGRYAFELRVDQRRRYRRWIQLKPSRRYNFFHR